MLAAETPLVHRSREQLRVGYRRCGLCVRHQLRRCVRCCDRPVGRSAGDDCPGESRAAVPTPILREARVVEAGSAGRTDVTWTNPAGANLPWCRSRWSGYIR